MKINQATISSPKMSHQELSIVMVGYWNIFKNNQITFFPCFTVVPKTVTGLPETPDRFYSANKSLSVLRLLFSYTLNLNLDTIRLGVSSACHPEIGYTRLLNSNLAIVRIPENNL